MPDQITTHILDIGRGVPAAGVEVRLYADGESGWVRIAQRHTDNDGRVTTWPGGQFDSDLAAGSYKLRFETSAYYDTLDIESFYPHVEILFRIAGDGQHYHVPLLLSPFGYSTYRGS